MKQPFFFLVSTLLVRLGNLAGRWAVYFWSFFLHFTFDLAWEFRKGFFAVFSFDLGDGSQKIIESSKFKMGSA